MKTSRLVSLFLALGSTGSIAHAQVLGQEQRYPDSSKSLALHLTSQSCFYSGEKPDIKLSINNRTDTEIVVPNGPVHVECEGHEPPTLYMQRVWTHTLLPGESAPMPSGYNTFIMPKTIFVSTYQLSYFYDLTRPGQCSAYIAVFDTKSDPPVQLRSNTVRFDLKPHESRPTVTDTPQTCKGNEKHID